MSRYIDADELIFIGIDNPDDDNLFEFVPREFIDNAPTADVQPVVRGEWELIDAEEPIRYGCSVCKRLSWVMSNYCPNCGARMVKE